MKSLSTAAAPIYLAQSSLSLHRPSAHRLKRGKSDLEEVDLGTRWLECGMLDLGDELGVAQHPVDGGG